MQAAANDGFVYVCMYVYLFIEALLEARARDERQADALAQGQVQAALHGTFIDLQIVYVYVYISIHRSAATVHLLTCVIM